MADAGIRWRCETCVCPLAYLELWQDPETAKVYCGDCWHQDHASQGIFNTQPVLPALVCDACYAPMRPLFNLSERWTGLMALPDICEDCANPVTDEEELDALSALLNVLGDTDEEG